MIEMYLIFFMCEAECNKRLFHIIIFGGDNRL